VTTPPPSRFAQRVRLRELTARASRGLTLEEQHELIMLALELLGVANLEPEP
jgi:hypothetical protein